MVIKPAAWLRSNQALQSAKNNVRRVPGSDGDSFLRLRWRPGTVSQRCSLVLLPCSGRTRRSGAANAAGSAARVPCAKDSRSQPRRRLQSARGCGPPPGGRERDNRLAIESLRDSLPVCALSLERPDSPGLQQVAAEGDWGSGVNPGGPASWPEGLKECEGGAGQGGAARPARDARPAAAGQHPSAARVRAHDRLGSLACHRAGANPGLRGWVRCSYAGQPRPFPTWVGEK